MIRETADVESFVSGILAGIQPDDDELGIEKAAALLNVKKAAALLSVVTDKMLFQAPELRHVAREMIARGFNFDPREFVLAFARYQDSLREDQDYLCTYQQEMLDQYMPEAINEITCDLNGDEVRPTVDEIESAVAALMLVSDSNQGLANQLIRLCGQRIDLEIVDQYCEDHPYADSPDSCCADRVRELLLQGMFNNLGFWRIWCMIRRFFLGKNPDGAEAEMEKEKEIGHLRGLLEGSWKHYLPVKSLDSENIIRDECAFLQRLLEIDPDYYPWLKSTHPGEKRLESTEIGRLIKKSTSDSNA